MPELNLLVGDVGKDKLVSLLAAGKTSSGLFPIMVPVMNQ